LELQQNSLTFACHISTIHDSKSDVKGALLNDSAEKRNDRRTHASKKLSALDATRLTMF
jgi:hypothetical protein